MSIGGNNLLSLIEKENPRLGQYLRRYVVPAIKKTAQNAGVSATGKIAPPAPPESVNVTTQGEFMQITVNHAAPIQKGIQYISHISTNPEFSQPLILDHGSSRSPLPFQLPTKDGSGAAINYYVRTLAQYPGSDPSPPTYHGGDAPAAITLGGVTQMDLAAGTGSGTGSSNGQQSHVGLGTVIFRAAPAPKRNVSPGRVNSGRPRAGSNSVILSGAPIIPSGALSSGILDNYGPQPWLSVHDTGTPGTSSGTSTYISPAVGRHFNFIYTANAGQRYSLYFGDDTLAQNFCYDLEVAFTDPTQILNMEMDMNQVMADGDTVIYDCQCAHGSAHWEVDGWHATTVAGDPQTWGVSTYHHVRIFWHRDLAGTLTTWDGVEFDGVWNPFIAETGNTKFTLGWAVGRLVINFQIEGSSAVSGTVDAFGRNIQVWRW
jgi:hypothetical protein